MFGGATDTVRRFAFLIGGFGENQFHMPQAARDLGAEAILIGEMSEFIVIACLEMGLPVVESLHSMSEDAGHPPPGAVAGRAPARAAGALHPQRRRGDVRKLRFRESRRFPESWNLYNISKLMTVNIARRLFSTSDYARMRESGILAEDDRVELIGGEVRAMTPIGPLHAAVVKRLNILFIQRLAATAIVSVQDPDPTKRLLRTATGSGRAAPAR